MKVGNFLALSILILLTLFPLFLTTSFIKRAIALFQLLILTTILVLLQFREIRDLQIEASIIVVIVPMFTVFAFLYYYLKSRLKV